MFRLNGTQDRDLLIDPERITVIAVRLIRQ